MKGVANRFYNQLICMRKRDETLSALTQIQRILFCFGSLCARKQQLKFHGNCFISAITKRQGVATRIQSGENGEKFALKSSKAIRRSL